jgi:uncharacterized protein YkwD
LREGAHRDEDDVGFHRIFSERAQARLAQFGCGLLLGAFVSSAPARADALADVQLLRESGCGGQEAAAAPLRHIQRLDRTAERWAAGYPIGTSAERAAYAAERLKGVHVTGTEAATLQILRRTSCVTLMSRNLSDVGVYRRGLDSWLVLGSSHDESPHAPLAAFAPRVLELVNEVRAKGTSCGARAFGPVGPVRRSATLDQVAYGHANDMAQHVYFEHQDLAGRTPADRVRAVGYPERLVGENIAYGLDTPEEVVRGWLDSVGHCENIMDPRFVEMGIGHAVGPAPQRDSGRGLYWVQVLADPKI